MKLYRAGRWRSAVLALVVAAGCGDGLPPEQGTFVGLWDGHPWVGDAHLTLLRGATGGDVLYVSGASPRGAGPFQVREAISAHVAFRGVGVYSLEAGDVSFVELTGGDVISASYAGVGSPAGRLSISRYDESTGEMEGELRFSASSDSPYASYGSTAALEDGKFRGIVTVQPVNTRAP